MKDKFNYSDDLDRAFKDISINKNSEDLLGKVVDYNYNDDFINTKKNVRNYPSSSFNNKKNNKKVSKRRPMSKLTKGILYTLGASILILLLIDYLNDQYMNYGSSRIVNVEDFQMTDAIFLEVAKSANLQQMKKAFLYDANPEALDIRKRGPIDNAIISNPNEDAIILLTKKTKNINKRDLQGFTPLIIAVNSKRSLGIIKALVEKGANVNATTKAGTSVLMAAATGSNALDLPVIKYLIKNGADVNYKNKNSVTPLLMSVETSNGQEIPAYLVSQGADFFAKDSLGKSVLDIARINASLSDSEFIKQLEAAYIKLKETRNISNINKSTNKTQN